MTINDNMTEFMGRQIEDFQTSLDNPTRVAYRIGREYDADTQEELDRLLQDPNAGNLQALIISTWPGTTERETPKAFLQTLIEAKDTLKNLKSFFLGDMTFEQFEMSWIQQCDVSPFLSAYPELLHFGVRGGDGLNFSKIKHESLRTLIVETGGLRTKTLKQICALDLPALEHLDLWLGSDDYGGDITTDDLEPLLQNTELFPALNRLGLRNSTDTDSLCAALKDAPILEKIFHLDLSMGTISDEGAEHLLQSEGVKNLESLDLSHHYLSDAMQKRLKESLKNVAINLDNPQGTSEDRYCVVSE